MATPAQAAAATVGAGSLAAAGAYGITQAVSGSEQETDTQEETTTEDNSMPENPVVFNASEVTAPTYNNVFLSLTDTSHLEHLVKPENNEKWWDWAFKNKYKAEKVNNQFDNTFQNLTDSSALSKACGQAYKKPKTEYSFLTTSHLLKNISAFCTKGSDIFDVSKPKAIVYDSSTTPTNYTTGLLTEQSNRDKLVKSKIDTSEKQTNHNDLWWNWAFKNLLTQDAKATATNSFKTLTLGYKEETESSATSLNNACDEAYKKGYTELKTVTNSASLINDIKRFCSKDPSNTELSLPEPSTTSDLLSKSDSTYANNELIKANENKLVDPKKAQDWWNWIFQKNYPKTTDEKTKLPEPFKTVDKGYEDVSGSGGTNNSLNKACQTAYSKDKKTMGENNLLQKIKEFCSPTTISGNLAEPAA